MIVKNENIEIISLDYSKYKDVITNQKNKETFANLASLLQSFQLGKEKSEDLIFFIESNSLLKSCRI